MPAGLTIRDFRSWSIRERASGRRYVVVRLRTESGIAGYGECISATAEELERARTSVTGKSASDLEPVRRELAGIPVYAACDIAMLDILGKAARTPVYQLLGGPTRNKVRALTPLTGSIAGLVRTGHRAVSVPLPQPASANQGQAYISAVRRNLETLRTEGGENVDFVLLGGGSLSPSDAAGVARAIEHLHPMWFDEPCPTANLRAIAKIAETVVPLGFGSGFQSAAQFQELLREDVIDVFRPAIGLNGITQIRRMAALAEINYIAVAPSHEGARIGTAAALHLAASLPNFIIQQIPPGTATVRDGFVDLPTGPGLGIDVDEYALAREEVRA
jgi:galactonate dehydratase